MALAVESVERIAMQTVTLAPYAPYILFRLATGPVTFRADTPARKKRLQSHVTVGKRDLAAEDCDCRAELQCVMVALAPELRRDWEKADKLQETTRMCLQPVRRDVRFLLSGSKFETKMQSMDCEGASCLPRMILAVPG